MTHDETDDDWASFLSELVLATDEAPKAPPLSPDSEATGIPTNFVNLYQLVLGQAARFVSKAQEDSEPGQLETLVEAFIAHVRDRGDLKLDHSFYAGLAVGVQYSMIAVTDNVENAMQASVYLTAAALIAERELRKGTR